MVLAARWSTIDRWRVFSGRVGRGREAEAKEKKTRFFFRLKGLQTLEDAIPYMCGEDLVQTFLCLRTSEKQTDCKPLCLRVVCASQTEEVT